jgi:peptidoglycan/xylan/chitin deacetylase (PgdA/CDA1 family)
MSGKMKGCADIIPSLMVVVDTEEEFDWTAPHDRDRTSVHAMRHIERGQEIFDEFGIKPCYVVDYPVVSQLEGYEALLRIHASERCEIGAHLHPWVNPPHEEDVTRLNSFPGNLPAELERRKLQVLTDRIAEIFGEPPRSYKAGRYGLGPNSLSILRNLGYRIDLSVCPGYDYSQEGGPDFSTSTNQVLRARDSEILQFPCTGGFVGWLAPSGAGTFRLASSSAGTALRLPGVLARLGLLERIRLSPEGFSLRDMIKLTEHLVERDVRLFTLSFHSPSLGPGHTPYVHSNSDLQGFIGKISSYLQYFKNAFGGRFVSPMQMYREMIDEPVRAMDTRVN